MPHQIREHYFQPHSVLWSAAGCTKWEIGEWQSNTYPTDKAYSTLHITGTREIGMYNHVFVIITVCNLFSEIYMTVRNQAYLSLRYDDTTLVMRWLDGEAILCVGNPYIGKCLDILKRALANAVQQS